jgi:hypothetical protein
MTLFHLHWKSKPVSHKKNIQDLLPSSPHIEILYDPVQSPFQFTLRKVATYLKPCSESYISGPDGMTCIQEVPDSKLC